MMKTMTQAIDLHPYDLQVRRIKAKASAVLSRRKLLPRFKRWRLTQDPGTGMIVLFGIINDKYIAKHTSIPFLEYFNPPLLRELANELQVQVVSCNSDGLRYAFILDRGSVDKFPMHIDYPFLEGDRHYIRAVYNTEQVPGWMKPESTPILPAKVDVTGEEARLDPGLVALLNTFADSQLNAEVESQLPLKGLPDIIMIDEEEFQKQVAEHKVIWQKSHPG
jgi:hypothetical protein